MGSGSMAGLNWILGVVRMRLPGFVRRSRGGGTSIWRVLALAIVVYVAALNLANFVIVRPVRGRLDKLVAQKTVVEDFLILKQSGQAVAAVRDAVMRGDERVTVLGDVKEMALDSGLKVVGDPVLLSPREASKKMTEYPAKLSLRGSYHEVGEFLSRLEGSPRLLSVREVKIDASGTSASRADVTVLIGVLSWEE